MHCSVVNVSPSGDSEASILFPVLLLMSCVILGKSLSFFVPHSSGKNELTPCPPDYFLVGNLDTHMRTKIVLSGVTWIIGALGEGAGDGGW